MAAAELIVERGTKSTMYRLASREATESDEGPLILFKTYEDRLPVSEPILGSDSDHRPAANRFHREKGILRIVRDSIPPDELLPPRMYVATPGRKNDSDSEVFMGYTGRDPAIALEILQGPNRMELIIAAISEGVDPFKAIEGVPEEVAAIHQQLNYAQVKEHRRGFISMRDRLRKTVVWNHWGHTTYGVRLQSFEESRAKLWHHLRAAGYAMSPKFKDLRARTAKKVREEKHHLRERYGSLRSQEAKSSLHEAMVRFRHHANESMKSVLQNSGIDASSYTDDMVRYHNRVLFGVDDPRKKSSHDPKSRLLRDLRVQVVTGDLGPQHLYRGGRFIDLDEARLDAGEVDVASALYSMFLYPRGDDANTKEVRLMELSFQYLKAMLGREPVEQEKIDYVIRTTGARLREMERLFAADCKASSDELKGFVKGHPKYVEMSGAQLRQSVLNDFFIPGLQHLYDFWARGDGWKLISGVGGPADDLRKRLEMSERYFDVLDVVKGVGDPDTFALLEDLVR
jgi:hypothetical protein